MASSNFKDCLTRVLKDEGGYSNDPNDNGGPTKFGITLADYRKYIDRKGTAEDVKNMAVDQAAVIYRRRYWDALNCDSLPSGVDYTCFDYGVNSGLGRPRKALQRFKSLSGISLINAINNERTAFLKAIGVGHNEKFLRGWLARVERVRAHSIELSKQVPQTPKTVAGLFTGVAAMFSNGYHWVLAHPIEAAGIGVCMGLLTYAIVHFTHKAIKNG